MQGLPYQTKRECSAVQCSAPPYQEGSPFTPPYLAPLPSLSAAQLAQWRENFCRKNYWIWEYLNKLGVKLSDHSDEQLKIINLRRGIDRKLDS